MLAASLSVLAEDTSPTASPAETPTPTPDANQPEMTANELAEKQARRACKVKLCDILATKDLQGDDVSCDIVKTWREADITKIFGGRIDWPWGKALCQLKLEIKRKQLVKAMTEATYEVALPEQKVSCTLEHLPSNTGN